MQKLNRPIHLFMVISAIIGVSPVNAQSDWEYRASVYGWFAGIEGTVGVGIIEEQVYATTSDLFKNLEFTGGAHFEARNPSVSLIADLFYMGLGQDVEIQRNLGNPTVTYSGKLDLDEWVIEGAVGYRTTEKFELLLAGRLYSINSELVFEDNSGSAAKSWIDIFFGCRYMTDFEDDWYASLRAEIGTGGSTLAWFSSAALEYRFSKLFSISLDYRILSMDYEEGSGRDYFKYDTFNHGAGLAAVFNF